MSHGVSREVASKMNGENVSSRSVSLAKTERRSLEKMMIINLIQLKVKLVFHVFRDDNDFNAGLLRLLRQLFHVSYLASSHKDENLDSGSKKDVT